MTHPQHQAATTAVEALRQAWRWSTTPPVPVRRTTPTPAPSPRALARRSALYAAERADRYRLTRDHTSPTGDTGEPVNLALIDARRYTLETVVDAAWIAASDVRRRPLLVFGDAWGTVRRDTFERTTRYIRLVAPFLRPNTAAELAELLDGAARRLRSALDIGDTRTPLPGRACPECDRRTLTVDTATNTITCTYSGCDYTDTPYSAHAA